MRYHKLLSNKKGDRRSGTSSDSETVSLLSSVFASRCWPRLNTMLEDVGLILNLLKISSNIMQHCWANNVA